MFCTTCGAPLVETDRFCSACGAVVKKDSPAHRAPTSTPQRPATTARTADSTGRGGWLAWAIGIIVLLAVGTGVWVWLASRDAEPTERPQAAVNTASGGLGLTVDEWRAVYGAPIDTQFDEHLDRYPGDGGYDVDIRFVMNPTDRMTQLEFTFDPPVAPDVAESVIAAYLPTDATVVDAYRDDLADQPVVLYHSDWLAEVLGPGSDDIWWGDAQPGSFFVISWWQDNDLTTGVITDAMVGLSHSP